MTFITVYETKNNVPSKLAPFANHNTSQSQASVIEQDNCGVVLALLCVCLLKNIDS